VRGAMYRMLVARGSVALRLEQEMRLRVQHDAPQHDARCTLHDECVFTHATFVLR
jgi:hypothetical protein